MCILHLVSIKQLSVMRQAKMYLHLAVLSIFEFYFPEFNFKFYFPF